MMLVKSPNNSVQPSTATVNEHGHLVIGGADCTKLAEQFGTPLWIMDEKTILNAIEAYKQGLSAYPNSMILYAGKAFLCLAMCHLIKQQGIGLDVVSAGELYTASKANFPADKIFMHGNNKSAEEIRMGLSMGDVKIVVDSASELHMVAAIAKDLGKKANVLFRVIPGVEPDTHQHIVTGHDDSKFGIPLQSLNELVSKALSLSEQINLCGLHAHIGSQAMELQPYLEHIDILGETLAGLKNNFDIELPILDVGGGLGISYVETDKPIAIYDWTKGVAAAVKATMEKQGLKQPQLFIEPGRSIVGTAGVTLYRAGHTKKLPSGVTYVAVDGGMADNPRPITYQAKYTAVVANRMNAAPRKNALSLAGKFCESGDIIIKETFLPAETGDLVAVFGTGAYNYSMASNYNRTGRPTCVLVSNGNAEVILERESYDDLLKQDRVPGRLSK